MVDHIETYKLLRPKVEAFAERLKALLFDIAQTSKIDVHAIEARAKTIESFTEKLSRPGKTYRNPLEEINDLCGLRIILYYQEDVDKYCEAIRNEFIVDGSSSVDKRRELNSDQFGYISVHLVCQLSKDRVKLVEWRNYADLKVEVQVRTVLQHAWASISHALHYKREADVPYQFGRKLTRIAGLLELSDEQFSELRNQSEVLKSVISKSLHKNNLDVDINSIAISQFLASAKVVQDIENAARAVGFSIESEIEMEQLVMFCRGFRVQKLSQLQESLDVFADDALQFFRCFAVLEEQVGMNPRQVRGDRDHWCAIAVVAFFHNKWDTSFIADQGLWSQQYLENVLEAAKSIRS